MVALMLLGSALAGPVALPEPDVQSLDATDVVRVPAFSGSGPVVPMPDWGPDAWPEPLADGRHIVLDDYETLSLGTLGGQVRWTVRAEGGSDARLVGDQLLTSLGYDDGFALRDLGTGRIEARFEGPMPDAFVSAPGGDRIASGDSAVRILTMAGDVQQTWETGEYPEHLQFSRDGKRLLICDGDRLRVWDLVRDRIVFFEQDDEWGSCTADPDLTVAYVGRGDGVIERVPLTWDAPRTAWRVGSWVGDLDWVAPDVVFVVTEAPHTSVVDLAKARVVAHLEGPAHEVHAAEGRLTRIGDSVRSWSWPQLEPLSDQARQWDPTAVAADADVVATGDSEGTVLVTRGDRIVQHLWGFASDITDLDLHADRLAVGDRDGVVSIVAWKTGEVLHRLELGGGDSFAEWSPDGSRLVVSVAEEDETSWIEIWDTRSWTRLHRSEQQRLVSFAFASHGRWFAAGGIGSTGVVVIDTETGRVHRRVGGRYSQEWTRVGVVEDQQVVAYVVGDDDNQLWYPPAAPVEVEAWGWAAAFTEDGRKLAYDVDEELVVIDAVSGRELLRKPVQQVYAMAWRPDGRSLVTVHRGGGPRSWSVPTDGSPAVRDDLSSLEVADLSGVEPWTAARSRSLGYPAGQLAVAPDGRIAVASVDSGALVLEPEGDELARIGGFRDYSNAIEHVWFAADGTLVTSDNDRTTEVWRDGEVVDSQTRCEGGTLVDGAIRCAEDDDADPAWRGAVEVGGQPLPSQPGEPTRSALSPDGRYLVAAGKQLAVVWDVKSRQPVGQLAGRAEDAVVWSADGRYVLTLGGGELVWWAAP